MSFTPSSLDRPIYDYLWTIAFQTNNIPVSLELGGQPAVTFLKRSGVDTGILKQIWTLSTPNPMMNINEFYTAIRYIVMFQNGEMPLTRDRLIATSNEKFDLPKFNDIKLPITNVPTATTTGVGAAGSASSVSGSPLPYAITADDHEKYHKLFITYDTNGDGLLSGAESVGVLTKSGLSQDVLGVIWNLADDDKDGSLTSKEFCVAFHLIICISKKGMPVPQTLPQALRAFLQNAPAVPVSVTATPTPTATTTAAVPIVATSPAPIIPLTPAPVTASVSEDKPKPVSKISTIDVPESNNGLSEREEADLMSSIVSIKETTQKALTITDKAIETSSKGMESLRALMQKLQGERIAINSRIEASEQATKETDSKMDTVVIEITELQTELSKLRKDLDEAKEKEFEARAKATTGPKLQEKQNLINQIEETRRQLDLIKNENVRNSESITSLNNEKADINSKLQPLAVEESKLTDEINQLKADVSALTLELTKLNKDNESKRNEVANGQQDLKKLQETLLRKEQSIGSLREQKDDILEEKETLTQKVDDAKAFEEFPAPVSSGFESFGDTDDSFKAEKFDTFDPATDDPFGAPITSDVAADPFGAPITSDIAADPFGEPITSDVAADPFGEPITTFTGFESPSTSTSFESPTLATSVNGDPFGAPISSNDDPFGEPITSDTTADPFGEPVSFNPVESATSTGFDDGFAAFPSTADPFSDSAISKDVDAFNAFGDTTNAFGDTGDAFASFDSKSAFPAFGEESSSSSSSSTTTTTTSATAGFDASW